MGTPEIEASKPAKGRRFHLPLMLILTGLFVLRVLAQLVQAVQEVPVIPPFDAWQGSGLPYPILLGSQVLIIAVITVVLWRIRTNAFSPSPWKYWTCFTLGGIYFAVMVFRLVAGLTFLSENDWFSTSLPALFHVILASLILIFGHYLLTIGNESARS